MNYHYDYYYYCYKETSIKYYVLILMMINETRDQTQMNKETKVVININEKEIKGRIL